MTALLALPPFTDFSAAFEAENYRPIPDTWLAAVSDVVDSTLAIARGRYKDVNMAGAATIAGVLNACGRDDLPFAFGGDGGVVIVPPEYEARCRAALLGVKQMCARILDLNLRCSLVPVGELRKHGCKVLAGAYDLGSGRHLTMLAGGGTDAAEQLCKSPEGAAFAVSGGEGECDLTGLSCRWEPLKSQFGTIMSLIVRSRDRTAPMPAIYRDIYARLSAIAGAEGSPSKAGVFAIKWPPSGWALEAALPSREGRFFRRARILMETAFMRASLRSGKPIGGFDARAYVESLPRHSDYRKYADSLRMVIDCSTTGADAIRALLDTEWKKGSIDFGTHVASAAIMTCFVRDTGDGGHVHFIDGADGGYALAAADMKMRMIGDSGAARIGSRL